MKNGFNFQPSPIPLGPGQRESWVAQMLDVLPFCAPQLLQLVVPKEHKIGITLTYQQKL